MLFDENAMCLSSLCKNKIYQSSDLFIISSFIHIDVSRFSSEVARAFSCLSRFSSEVARAFSRYQKICKQAS